MVTDRVPRETELKCITCGDAAQPPSEEVSVRVSNESGFVGNGIDGGKIVAAMLDLFQTLKLFKRQGRNYFKICEEFLKTFLVIFLKTVL